MSESAREAHPEVREWSGGPPGFLGVDGRPSRISGCGRKDHPDVWDWSGVIGMPSRRSRSGREAHPKVREWSVGPLEGPGGVGRPS